MTPIHLTTEALHIRILPRGAALTGVRFQPQGRNLVLGFAEPEDHLNIPVYAGALVGPVANRVSQGRVTVKGKTYQMERNENGITSLHSGAAGVHAHLWSVDTQSGTHVTLTTRLPDGVDGLPGDREITATYRVSEATLTLEITALSSKPTPMNIAAHPYWNLDGQADVRAHCLTVAANTFTPTDANNIPNGDIATTAQTPFDFETSKTVPLDPALDVNFCLAPAPRLKPVQAATLIGGDGTRLDIATTAPGLQVYNGAHLPKIEAALEDNRSLHPYGAIALEPQFWPDAPNIPAFPQITLDPGQVWHQRTTYRLTPAD